MDFLLRLDFRLDVLGIVGGDFSFSPVFSDEGLSNLSNKFSDKTYDMTHPGFAMVSGCWAPRRRDFGSVGVDDASATTFGFFARLGGVGPLVSTMFSGLGSRSGRVLRLRDLGRG